ncbi:MAG: ABC transporter substrate-binding protein [Cellulomonas sp. 73-145]|uniref:ABC transporter substrate-binding protein n=1 Tax=Cellulomonas sp. 73-145 TaxID=1895739 RepID=UPI00092951C2|nr:extracellular solute-binding protein [Cellulomonas sp. 73-145]MBN9328594.1 extracellular solute-binding protein [Cellulomonas sp.]OJV58807.1 MAG: ABC transporter substrate-binding protein [Cellulomonas sp. 73-145]
MRRGKGLTALTLAVAGAVTLAACGTGSSGGSGTTAASGGGVGTACASPTTVTFWQQKFEDYQQAWYKKYVDQFNSSQTCVKVDYKVVPADTWTQKLQAAQAAGNQPDVVTTNYGNIKPGVAQGQFAALDDYLPASALADIKSNVAPFVTEKGKHWGYPMLVEPSAVLYINSDMAKAAGLDPASPPKSWKDLVDWSTKLTSGNVKGITIASVAAELGWSSWGLQDNSCGHFPITDDWASGRATDSCFADVVNLYKTLYQNKLMPQNPKVGYTDAAPFESGEVAMMVNGSWALGAIKKDKPDLLAKTVVAALPTKDGGTGETTATLGGWTLTLDAKSKHPKEAAAFISYLAAGDPSIMADFFKQAGYSKYTTRTSVDKAIAANDPSTTQDANMKTISDDIVAHGIAEPAYPWDISLAMGTAIESGMKGTASVDAALKTANDSINSTIQKQQLKGTAPQS